MSAKEQRKLQRAMRRESRKVGPGIVHMINHSGFLARARFAWKVILGKVPAGELLAPLQDPNGPRAKLTVRARRSPNTGP